jgi:hypothetical protein
VNLKFTSAHGEIRTTQKSFIVIFLRSSEYHFFVAILACLNNKIVHFDKFLQIILNTFQSFLDKSNNFFTVKDIDFILF